jgi:hypothetical protein
MLEKTRQMDFLKVQSTIIDELHSRNHLQTFVLHLPPPNPRAIIKQFEKSLTDWSITPEFVEYTTFGDCIGANGTVLIGIHTGITGARINLPILRPPQIPTCLEDHIYAPFDNDKFTMSQYPSASDEEADDDTFEIKQSPPTPATPLSALNKYHLVRKGDQPAALVGTNVYSRKGTATPLDRYNFNPFHRLFGIKFKDSSAKTRIRIISPYEYCQCWNMDRNLIIDFARTVANIYLLESALPGKTSSAILEALLSKLTEIRLEQSTFLDSSAPAASAATAMPFMSGATTLKIPTI